MEFEGSLTKSRRTGSAMIVDAEKGLAVISRSIIPFDLGVLSLTFADSIIIPGKVCSPGRDYADSRLSICIRR